MIPLQPDIGMRLIWFSSCTAQQQQRQQQQQSQSIIQRLLLQLWLRRPRKIKLNFGLLHRNMQFWRAAVAMIYLEEHYGSELQHHKVLFNILKFHYFFSKFLPTHIPLKKKTTQRLLTSYVIKGKLILLQEVHWYNMCNEWVWNWSSGMGVGGINTE